MCAAPGRRGRFEAIDFTPDPEPRGSTMVCVGDLERSLQKYNEKLKSLGINKASSSFEIM